MANTTEYYGELFLSLCNLYSITPEDGLQAVQDRGEYLLQEPEDEGLIDE